MCDNCDLLEQRLEALESFVWERNIANNCNYNADGICTSEAVDEDDCSCHVSVCTDPEWETRG